MVVHSSSQHLEAADSERPRLFSQELLETKLTIHGFCYSPLSNKLNSHLFSKYGHINYNDRERDI